MTFHTGTRVAVPFLVAVVAGCADIERARDEPGWTIENVSHEPAPTDPMLAVLQAGYLRLASAELDEYDWNDGAEFLLKAKIAGEGSPPPPFTLADRDIVDETLKASLAEEEAQLLALLASEGALLRAPREIAEAQIDWECLIQEAEEGHQTPQIEACRVAFDRSLAAAKEAAQLPEMLVVVLPEEGGEIGGVVLSGDGGRDLLLDKPFAAGSNGGEVAILEDEVRAVFAKALDARPPRPSFYTIFFDAGSKAIDADGAAIVTQIVEDIRKRSALEIVLVGYSDGAGSGDAGQLLSRKRVKEVQGAIAAELSAEEKLKFLTSFVEETELAERRSRRVEVTLR